MSDPSSALAEITDLGLLVFHERAKWDSIVRTHKGKLVRVSMERAQPTRSSQANRRYWGVIVPVAREILNQGRQLPLSRMQIHEALKGAFIGHEETPLGLVPRSSRELTIPAFSEFMEKVEAHFRAEYGAEFPDTTEAA